MLDRLIKAVYWLWLGAMVLASSLVLKGDFTGQGTLKALFGSFIVGVTLSFAKKMFTQKN